MADPLSLTTGIAGAAIAGVQLSAVLVDLFDKYAGAPKEMSDLASEMDLLATMLEDLKDALEARRAVQGAVLVECAKGFGRV